MFVLFGSNFIPLLLLLFLLSLRSALFSTRTLIKAKIIRLLIPSIISRSLLYPVSLPVKSHLAKNISGLESARVLPRTLAIARFLTTERERVQDSETATRAGGGGGGKKRKRVRKRGSERATSSFSTPLRAAAGMENEVAAEFSHSLVIPSALAPSFRSSRHAPVACSSPWYSSSPFSHAALARSDTTRRDASRRALFTLFVLSSCTRSPPFSKLSPRKRAPHPGLLVTRGLTRNKAKRKIPRGERLRRGGGRVKCDLTSLCDSVSLV